jgi:MGT family glycosyltransferase
MVSAAIGRALETRGHRFTLLTSPLMAPWVEKEGVEACYFGPSPVISRQFEAHSKLTNLSPAKIIKALKEQAEYLHRELPVAIGKARPDCMIVDADFPAAASVSEALHLPFVTLCCALPFHGEPTVPPSFLGWSYRPDIFGRLRNQMAYAIRDYMARPLSHELNEFRKHHGLKPYHHPEDAFSPFSQITQLVAGFDFPRVKLPPCFHYVGPCYQHPGFEAPFPFERLDGRPLVYAALGTQLSVGSELWTTIAQACANLNVQLVIASSALSSSPESNELPGNPVVVSYAPQVHLLSRASLFITHAGLNSVLESLGSGVPMLALPFAADQFGVASRIVYHGVGETLGRERTSLDAVQKNISNLLRDSSYRSRCEPISRSVQSSGGAMAAAEIIERVGVTRQPCYAQDHELSRRNPERLARASGAVS